MKVDLGLTLNSPRHPYPGGRFKNAYELLNLRALKILMLYKNHIFQCMNKIFYVEFQRVPFKFCSKYLTLTLKNVDIYCEYLVKLSCHNGLHCIRGADL